jgi:glycosyltransferase involved in cell wall biosynthesis
LRVLMISKACVTGTYQRKLEELARLPDVQLSLVVPPYWRDGRRVLPLERTHTSGYEMHVLPMVFNGHFHVHFYRGLGSLVRQLQPDVLHIDEEPYNLATFQAMRLAKRHGAQALFFTWQNLRRRYPFPFSWLERYNLKHAGCAIAGNQEAASVLCAKGYHRAVYVVPQFGVDPAVYRKVPSDVQRHAAFVIGYVGRLVEEKGVQVLLRAVAGLDSDWQLRIIGDGPYRATLETLCGELSIEPHVVMEPWTPSAEMPRKLSGLDVLVLPSLTRSNWKEQFGRVLVEAMACQVPVVGSSSGEIPNVIGDAGLIFAEGHHDGLRERLSRLMGDGELRAALGEQGRARVLERFTQERVARQTFEAYQELLGMA